jgi:hypothetical protein
MVGLGLSDEHLIFHIHGHIDQYQRGSGFIASFADKETIRASPTTMVGIIGRAVVGATPLAPLLTFIVVRSHRRNQKLTVLTPFNLLSITEPPTGVARAPEHR